MKNKAVLTKNLGLTGPLDRKKNMAKLKMHFLKKTGNTMKSKTQHTHKRLFVDLQ